MRRAILTVGPQYAGKSTYCEKVVAAFPEVVIVSRDKIRIELYGSIWTDPYETDGSGAMTKMWQAAREQLARPDVTLILDCWNGNEKERAELAHGLRKAGADRVDAWYFITTFGTCLAWSYLRNPPTGKFTHQTTPFLYGRHYTAFHQGCMEAKECFDLVRCINPLADSPKTALSLTAPEQLLLWN